MEKIASISESNKQSDEDKLELTPQQLAFQAPSSSFREGEKIETELNPRGKESKETDVLMRDKEIDFKVTHSNKIQHSNKLISKPDIWQPHKKQIRHI